MPTNIFHILPCHSNETSKKESVIDPSQLKVGAKSNSIESRIKNIIWDYNDTKVKDNTSQEKLKKLEDLKE